MFIPCLSVSLVRMVENLLDVYKQLVRTVSPSTSQVALLRAFENCDFKTYLSCFFFYIYDITNNVWFGCLFSYYSGSFPFLQILYYLPFFLSAPDSQFFRPYRARLRGSLDHFQAAQPVVQVVLHDALSSVGVAMGLPGWGKAVTNCSQGLCKLEREPNRASAEIAASAAEPHYSSFNSIT